MRLKNLSLLLFKSSMKRKVFAFLFTIFCGLVSPAYADHVLEIKECELADSIQSGTTIVFFYANWCVHCKKLDPIYRKVATAFEGVVSFKKVDCDQCREVEPFIKYSMVGIPTLILFVEGQEVDRLVGFCEYDRLYEWISRKIES